MLVFGQAFDQPIALVVWPASLKQLSSGICFNQTRRRRGVVGLSLEELDMGPNFEQPTVGAAAWPSSLRVLKAAVPQQFEEQRAIDWEARREWPDLKFFCCAVVSKVPEEKITRS